VDAKPTQLTKFYQRVQCWNKFVNWGLIHYFQTCIGTTYVVLAKSSFLALKCGQAEPLGSTFVKWKNLHFPLSKLAQSLCVLFKKSVFGNPRLSLRMASRNKLILNTVLHSKRYLVNIN
jgi:hypothetical protein